MRGRRPTPSALNELHGNPGKRRPNKNEPKPSGDLRDPPDWLSASQQELWRHAIANAPPSMLRRLDRELLMVWVVAADTYREAARRLAKFGLMTKSPLQGVPLQNPYLAILNRQAQILIKVAAELGFSPSSRSRLSVIPGQSWDDNDAETDEFDAMMEEGRRLRASIIPTSREPH